MRDKINSFASKMRAATETLFANPATRYVVWAILTVTFSELLVQGIPAGVTYIFRRPLAFITAASVVYFSFALTLLAKRRLGVFILAECFWIGLAIADRVLLSYRVNPLSAVDFSIIFSVFSIINVYLSPLQIVLIIAAIAAAVATAVFLMIRLPKEPPDYKRLGIHILCAASVTVLCFFSSTLIYSAEIDSMNLPEVYDEFGFIYSFSLTCADRGIDRPDEYSRVNISNMLTEESTETSERTPESDPVSSETEAFPMTETEKNSDEPTESFDPNVIFVQLESFFDPELIVGLETTSDAIPNFRALRDAYPSGQLTVPVAGAGTVNTEFEVLCGIPISVFGLGEYPYETVLADTPCESLAYYLKNYGYVCHAIHNHTGTFYDRHVVMQNLGFDTFTPVEYMSGVRRNILGWAKDKILTDEITGALRSTNGADFVYAVSVQAHGKYVSVPGDYGDIGVSGNFNEETKYALEYYVNQIYETDAFVGELIDSLESIGEDTVVVFFGDHQPSLELTGDNIESGSIYTTEYVIWNNFGISADDVPLNSFSLGSYVLELLGIDGGVISTLHNAKHDDERYAEYLEELAYDLLFGEKYAYGGTFPYDVPEISYGWSEVVADISYIKNGTLYVIGDGFTEASVVFTDGRRRDTVYISDTLIIAVNIDEADEVFIAQVAEDGEIFGEVPCEITDEPTWDLEVIGGER